MILSHAHKFIFIKTSKTAGTSIELALEPLCGPNDVLTTHWEQKNGNGHANGNGYVARNYRGRFIPSLNLERPLRQLSRDLHNLREGRKYFNHMSAFEVRARAGADIFSRYFKFCFERNPWDKAVSTFFWEKDRRPGVPQDFETYVRTRKIPSRFDLYTLGGKLAVDFVGRYETLEEDFARALKQAGIANAPALPRAKSQFRPQKGHYRDYYSDESRAIIARRFAREIEMFGYTF